MTVGPSNLLRTILHTVVGASKCGVGATEGIVGATKGALGATEDRLSHPMVRSKFASHQRCDGKGGAEQHRTYVWCGGVRWGTRLERGERFCSGSPASCSRTCGGWSQVRFTRSRVRYDML